MLLSVFKLTKNPLFLKSDLRSTQSQINVTFLIYWEILKNFKISKKEFDAQHACWNKSKYNKDKKQNSKDEIKKNLQLNSKSEQQDKLILKISDLNIDLTAKKNASAENVKNENPVVVQNILKPISFGILEMEMSILSV